jgi:hypothetical protein
MRDRTGNYVLGLRTSLSLTVAARCFASSLCLRTRRCSDCRVIMVSPAHKRQRMLKAAKCLEAGPRATTPAELVLQPRLPATDELVAPATARPVPSGQAEPQQACGTTTQSRAPEAPPSSAGKSASLSDSHQVHSNADVTAAQRQTLLEAGTGSVAAAEPPLHSAITAAAPSQHRLPKAPVPIGGVAGGRTRARGAIVEALYQCHGRFLPADVPALAQLVCCAAILRATCVMIRDPAQELAVQTRASYGGQVNVYAQKFRCR